MIGVGPAEHQAGACHHGEHDESNSSENILATFVGRPETSCPSREYGSVSGMGEIYLNGDGAADWRGRDK